MRRTALLLTSLAVIAFGLSAVPSAQAAPTEPVTSIVSPSDAGLIPDAVVLTINTNYEIQCKNPSCARFYKFDGGSQVATCTSAGTGFQLPTVNLAAAASTNTVSGTSYKFQSGALNRLRVAALDGGEPACTLFHDSINVVR